MRMRRLLIIMLLMIFSISDFAFCGINVQNGSTKLYQEVQGLEWMEMSAGERMDHLMATMYLLNKNGVELSYEPEHYYDALYRKIQRDPSLNTSSIANILANCIYEKEYASRPALDLLKKKSSIKK